MQSSVNQIASVTLTMLVARKQKLFLNKDWLIKNINSIAYDLIKAIEDHFDSSNNNAFECTIIVLSHIAIYAVNCIVFNCGNELEK